MLSTDEISTKFQTDSYSGQDMTTSAILAKMGSPSLIPGYLIPYQLALISMAAFGTLTNGMVLGGFWLAGRSNMNSSSAHIANHTTLDKSTFP